VAVLACLAGGGWIELWQIWIISAAVGLGRSISGPASGAFLPQLVAPELLVQANSLGQVVRPLAMTLVGPALGGVLVGAFGFATAFALDAASFGFAVVALLAISSRPLPRKSVRSGLVDDLREGFAYVRTKTWIWGTLLMATLGVLLVLGPFDVLVPYIVKNDLGGGAAALGIVYATGGLGAICAAILTGQLGLSHPAGDLDDSRLGHGLRRPGRRRCRHRKLAGRALAPRLQRAHYVRRDHLDHAHSDARAGGSPWSCPQRRLAALGRARASLLCLHRPAADALGAREVLVGASLLAGVLAAATLLLPGMRAPPAATP
jgi:hypothetical protein